MMKRIPALVLILSFSVSLLAQVEKPRNLPAFDLKRLHFGFTVGFNTMDLRFVRNYEADGFLYADVSRVLPGFQVSIVSDLKLSADLNLRFLPGISFGSREIHFYEFNGSVPGDLIDLSGADNPVALGPSFLDFPLLFKYRSKRVNNYRPYVVGGLNFRYDMSAKRKGKYDTESNEYVKLLPGDLYIEFGFGTDTYLRYFKFAPEIKLAVGLLNVMDPTGRTGHLEMTNSIQKATSYIVMLNFHFE